MKNIKNKDVSRVAYLAGTSYCGSTLIALLMDCHPQIVSVGEASIDADVLKNSGTEYSCSCGEKLINCSFWQQIFHSVNQQGFEFSAINWTNDYRYKNPLFNKIFSVYSSHQVVRMFQEAAESILLIHRTRIQRINRVNIAFIQSVLNLTNAELFFDTSKDLMRLYYLLRIPELDIRIVRVVRDARAFANSFKRHKGKSVEKAAKHWKKHQLATENLIRMVNTQKVFLLRYEDLCQNPRYWLQSLYDFLEVEVLEPPDTITSQEHHVIGNSMRLKKEISIRFDEAWKDALTEEEVSLILSIAGGLNESFGYNQ